MESSKFQSQVDGVEVRAPVSAEFAEILTDDALRFVRTLQKQFSETRKGLLSKRLETQKRIDAGEIPNFMETMKALRSLNWRVGDIPADLLDRRVEITGPSGDRKMVINALNSGANAYMADFEDSQSPTWREVIQGQINLRDAVNRTIEFTSPEGRSYALNDRVATLIVRPRGWHLLEEHVFVDGEPVSASLFDFALYLYHNYERLREIHSGPYYYLPKLESHLEARLWNRVFDAAESYLSIPENSIKATVLIETLPAAFEMDEILYELRNHIVGLNCGRWDYIFSYIKKLRNHPQFTLPDRSQVTMDKGFLAAYVDLLIKTCHRRGAYAMGGMSAFIPVKGDEALNTRAFEKVRADKEREVRLGHDGTWVAHPGLVAVAKEVFDAKMKGNNQLDVLRDDVKASQDKMLAVPDGQVTDAGVQTNVSVGLQYVAAWLGGRGAVPINNLMEDAATAEICRAQLWQWIKQGTTTAEGHKVTADRVRGLVAEEVSRLSGQTRGSDSASRAEQAGEIFEHLVTSDEFRDFLTIPAYSVLLGNEKISDQAAEAVERKTGRSESPAPTAAKGGP